MKRVIAISALLFLPGCSLIPDPASLPPLSADIILFHYEW